jgi:hypothetical protein
MKVYGCFESKLRIVCGDAEASIVAIKSVGNLEENIKKIQII